MVMPNIPRRKIYEHMLEFEDGLIDLQIVLQNRQTYASYLHTFNERSFAKMRDAFYHIKGLLVLFLRNDTFSDDEQYEQHIQRLVKDQKGTNEALMGSKTLNDTCKQAIKEVDTVFSTYSSIDSLKTAEETYTHFEHFNHQIPKLLELAREEIKD